MNNIIEKIMLAYNLKKDELAKDFQCSVGDLEKMIAGKKEITAKGLVYLTKRFDISTDLIVNGNVLTEKDVMFIKTLDTALEKTKAQYTEEKLLKILQKEDFNFVDVRKLFNTRTGRVLPVVLINYKNAKLFKYLKNNKFEIEPQINSFQSRLSYEDNRRIGTDISSWDDVELILARLFNDEIHDEQFIDIVYEKLELSSKQTLLNAYREGVYRFNPKIILNLIEDGAHIINYDENDVRTIERIDVFETMLLKDYCEKAVGKN